MKDFEHKVNKAGKIMSKALRRWKCGLAFSGGKDSTALLHLAMQHDKSLPVVFNDTTVKFPESYAFIRQLQEEWGFEVHSTQDHMQTKWDEDLWNKDKVACCYRLKVEPFNKTVTDLGLGAVFVGVRRDEHPARAKAKYYDKAGAVTHISQVVFDHWRVHPLLDWSEADVWTYIRDQNLPYNPLYDKGYRSIGCAPCTEASPDGERAGREQDKELVMERLRELGYF